MTYDEATEHATLEESIVYALGYALEREGYALNARAGTRTLRGERMIRLGWDCISFALGRDLATKFELPGGVTMTFGAGTVIE